MSSSRQGRLLLGIDSATTHLALSLVEAKDPEQHAAGGAEVAGVVKELGRDHAAHIMAELNDLLERAGAARTDVAGVGVGVGPGSYTGVRIGVATALALGRAWQVPVGGASSLLALLGAGVEPGGRGVALLDARKGNVYALVAERLEGPHPAFLPVGEPVKVARAELDERFPGLPRFEGAPDAAILARLALAGGPLTPYYL